MRKITITIETVNDAFVGNPEQEVARILSDVVDRIEGGSTIPTALRDINGNKVGTIDIE